MVGMGAIGCSFSMLYFHAYRHRRFLKLNEMEVFEVVVTTANYALMAFLGLFSAAVIPPLLHRHHAGPGLMVYLVVMLAVSIIFMFITIRNRKCIRARMDAQVAA